VETNIEGQTATIEQQVVSIETLLAQIQADFTRKQAFVASLHAALDALKAG
jgi:hypothetical protein